MILKSEVTKYYYAGSQRIAIPQGDDVRKNGTLTFIIGDHLGSTSLVTDASGNVINQTQYKAWGETRYSSGTEQTKYGYTGQYSYVSDFGLHFYNARWYDSSLSRFAQADTIVPNMGSPEEWDRYSYTTNNPLRYTDPTGHRNCQEDGYNCKGDKDWKRPTKVVMMCGFSEGGPNSPGASCSGRNNPEQLSPHKKWWWGKGNYAPEYFDFPGNISQKAVNEFGGDGKKAQADTVLDKLLPTYKGESIIFGGYSAGGDAAIIAAWDAKFKHGMDVQGLYLIDPGYGTPTLSSADLTQKIQDLVNADIPVILLDSPGADGYLTVNGSTQRL